MSEIKFWIAFNILGLGPRSFQKLRSYFGNMEKAWRAKGSDLERAGLLSKTILNIISNRSKINPDKEFKKIQKLGIRILTIINCNYPKILLEINDAPPVLYLKGELTKSDEEAIAVVGTRRMTPYGKRATEKIVQGLAGNNLTIISGLALGIDSVAHRIALENGSRTIAVLGTGLDNIYPYSHRGLAEKIIQNGALISEFCLGTQGYASNFPQRNRIISGLALGTLVVEAAARSGTLITAKYALEQNREVFAVPGSIFSPQSESCLNLIKMGARLVSDYKDILDELNIKDQWQGQNKADVEPESEQETKILNSLDYNTAKHINKIIAKTRFETSKVLSLLTLMEMKGLIKNLGGQNYVRR